MSNGSTSFVEQLRSDFTKAPVGFRVVLPDGHHAIVKQCIESPDGRVYRVQHCTNRGRYVVVDPPARRHYAESELRLHYWSATISPDWTRS